MQNEVILPTTYRHVINILVPEVRTQNWKVGINIKVLYLHSYVDRQLFELLQRIWERAHMHVQNTRLHACFHYYYFYR